MACIWKDPRTRFWVACFTSRDGRRLKKTTKTTDRKKAQRIADSLEKVARDKQTAKTVRAAITALSQEVWGVEVVSTSVREHFANWLTEKRASSATSTMEFYERSCEKFLTFLGPAADEPVEHIERGHVARYKIEISKKLAAKTINHHVKLLRMVFKAARRDGLIDEDPAEFVETIRKTAASARRPFSIKELQAVIAACDEEWRGMVLCGIYTGQRLADIADMRWRNVDLLKKEIRLTARKTNRLMTIPIAPPLLEHLEALPSSDDRDAPLHPKACAVLSKQGRVGTLSNQFIAILVQAGLRDSASLNKKGTGKGRHAKRQSHGLSFHSLRHTAVTLLKEAGIPAAVVMELIGHDSEEMSRHYTHVGREALEGATLKFPDVTRS